MLTTIVLAGLTSVVTANPFEFSPFGWQQIDLSSEEHWEFQSDMSDEFSTNSISNKWQTSFPDWDGTPPAVITSGNVVASEGSLLIQAKEDASFDFSTVGDPGSQCSCGYETYTTGLVMSTFDFGPGTDSWYIEILARPAQANVRSNIWLQGETGEFSAFEMHAKNSDNTRNSACATSFHKFDDVETSASYSESSADCMSTSMLRYGMKFKGGKFITYVNGVEKSNVDVSTLGGDFDGINQNFKLILDVFVNASDGLPNLSTPASMQVDYVRVWKASENAGYETNTADTQVCSSVSSPSQKAVVQRVLGSGTSYDECASKCDEIFNCFFFTLSDTGVCLFFKSCDTLAWASASYRFIRLESNQPPEARVSELDGYTEHSKTQVCDETADGVDLAPKRVWGQGTPEVCAAGCNRQTSCQFISVTDTGWCTLFTACSTTKAASAQTVYSRDPFKKISIEERCDKVADSAHFRSLGGRGNTQEACLAGCEADPSCAYAVYYSLKGFCHYFSGTCENRIPAQGGSELYEMVGGAKLPVVDGFEYVELTNCDKNNRDDNIRADPFSLGGGGHLFVTCQAACTANVECNFFTHSITGYCFMYNTCDATKATTAAKLKLYSRKVGGSLSSAAPFISNHASTPVFVSGVVISMIVVGALVWRRRRRAMAFEQVTSKPDNEVEPLLMVGDMETVAMYT
eukprot:m.257804 g.257804  ORF g.257804 m.257804 type:complete len:689 (-) comp35732_c0_seq1:557-2623(-)